MASKLLVILVGLGLTEAWPHRERRQSGCTETFQNVQNVCETNQNGQVFFAHPTDPEKFLQCDVFNRMYVIQCPRGEIYFTTTMSCQPGTPEIPSTTVTTTRVPTTVPLANPQNPCTAEAASRGQLYFSVPGDSSSFYECDLQGNANLISCPSSLVWDQSILACVYPKDAHYAGDRTTPDPSALGGSGNPCSPDVAAGQLFYPHEDENKFIQCDLWGDAFVNTCPSNLVWNAALETCYRPSLIGRK